MSLIKEIKRWSDPKAKKGVHDDLKNKILVAKLTDLRRTTGID